MSDRTAENPLDPSPATLQAIDAMSQRLWEAEGKPDGGPAAYREQADELVRMEMAGKTAQLDPDHAPGMIVEEASIQANLGEFPGGSSVADQGEWRETPMTRDELRHGGDAEPGRGDAP